MGYFVLSMDGLGVGNFLSLFGSFLYIILVFALIIGVCWFILRLTGRVRARGAANANLHLVESIGVGAQNMVQIVKAGERYLVLGVSRERVSLLTELDAEQIKEIQPLQPMGASFKSIMERFMPSKDSDEGNDLDREN